jgi:hypothetical protein
MLASESTKREHLRLSNACDCFDGRCGASANGDVHHRLLLSIVRQRSDAIPGHLWTRSRHGSGERDFALLALMFNTGAQALSQVFPDSLAPIAKAMCHSTWAARLRDARA